MFPKKSDKPKKATMLAVDLGPMDPLEGKKPAEKKPEFGKPPKPTMEHEAAETPEYEAAEEYGAKLVQDLEAAGEEHGLDKQQTRAVAASFFRALAECLSSEETAEGSEPQAEEDGEDGIY